MVSFQCDGCADTVKKPQLDKHRQRCWASFTCLDCSKTFQNQDYKSHTSCVSEAEKYQGALYKGPRKGQQQPNHRQNGPRGKAAPVSNFTEAPTPNPAEVTAPSIHPSRQSAHDSAAAASGSGSGSGQGASSYESNGYGGRGRFQRGGYAGRGGFGARGGGQAGAVKRSVTGQNAFAPEGGMRSWGSPADGADVDAGTQAATVPTAAAGEGEAEKKKKKRKGDKGGTGSKANSKNKAADESAMAQAPAPAPAPAAAADEPTSKKRKRDEPAAAAEAAPAPAPTSAAPSDKTVKRVRKQLAKVAAASALPLADFVEAVCGTGGKSVDGADALRALKVSFADGKWVVSV
ncbi:hypothetical protein Q5752_001521 [Cryptotrichosporon argae]